LLLPNSGQHFRKVIVRRKGKLAQKKLQFWWKGRQQYVIKISAQNSKKSALGDNV